MIISGRISDPFPSLPEVFYICGGKPVLFPFCFFLPFFAALLFPRIEFFLYILLKRRSEMYSELWRQKIGGSAIVYARKISLSLHRLFYPPLSLPPSIDLAPRKGPRAHGTFWGSNISTLYCSSAQFSFEIQISFHLTPAAFPYLKPRVRLYPPTDLLPQHEKRDRSFSRTH